MSSTSDAGLCEEEGVLSRENGGKKLSTVSARVGSRGGGEAIVGGKTESINEPNCCESERVGREVEDED